MFKNHFLPLIQCFKQTHRRSYPKYLKNALRFDDLGIKRQQLSEYSDLDMYYCAENLLMELEWHIEGHAGLKKFYCDLKNLLNQFMEKQNYYLQDGANPI